MRQPAGNVVIGLFIGGIGITIGVITGVSEFFEQLNRNTGNTKIANNFFILILIYFNKIFYCGEVFQNKINTLLQNHKNGLTE